MFGDIRQGDSSLLQFGGTTVSCVHVPYRSWRACRVRNISAGIPIVPTANWCAVVIRHEGTTTLDLGGSRERLLKQRIDCDIKHGPEASRSTITPLTTSGLRFLAIEDGLPVRRERNDPNRLLGDNDAPPGSSATSP
jgi:hypothetical protein